MHSLTRHTVGCPNARRANAEPHHAARLTCGVMRSKCALNGCCLGARKNISAKACGGNRYSRQRTDQCPCVSCTTTPPRQLMPTYSVHHAAQDTFVWVKYRSPVQILVTFWSVLRGNMGRSGLVGANKASVIPPE